MKPSEKKIPPVCWLFCNVIDNYGDIGVSWRLAQSLYQELGWTVYLWVDDTATLRALCPNLPEPPCRYQHIHIYTWQAGLTAEGVTHAPLPQIVIETFACELPASVLRIINQTRPLWLNWEYLSAETAHERLHALPSPQANGLQKYFWFMGFSEKSGGLLREQNYAEQCRFNAQELRHQLLLPEKTAPEWLLFGYQSPVWAKWLTMWLQSGQAITLLLAGNQIINSLKSSGTIPADALLHDGDCFKMAAVTFIKIPFLPQHDFDRLLHLSDGLIIRGEDSFVRAQLAAKPFFWHTYPQDDKVHLDKLDAFWEKAYSLYPEEIRIAHRMLSEELNDGYALDANQRLAAWQTLQRHLPEWQKSVADWQKSLCSQASAIEKLAKFTQDKLK